MIHVAFIVSRINRGGPINQLYYICKYLDRERIEFSIITTSPSNNGNNYHDTFKKMGITVHSLNFGKVESIIKAVSIIQNIVNSNKIDVVQSYGFRAEYLASRLKGVSRITTIRNRPLFNYQTIYGVLLGTLYCHTHIHFTKKFDAIIACSETVTKEVIRFGIDAIVIRNAVDLPDIPLFDRTTARKRLELETNRKIVLTIASTLPGKNEEFILKNFRRDFFRETFLLLVAGTAPESLRKHYTHDPNVMFVGKVPNIFDYYAASDYFVSASLSEGMPNSPLEAISMGVPVLLSDIAAHREIFDTAKLPVGLLFTNNDDDSFTSTFHEIISRDFRQLSNTCKKVANENFNAEKMSQAYQQIYLQLADRHT